MKFSNKENLHLKSTSLTDVNVNQGDYTQKSYQYESNSRGKNKTVSHWSVY